MTILVSEVLEASEQYGDNNCVVSHVMKKRSSTLQDVFLEYKSC